MKQALVVAALFAAGCASVAPPPTQLPETRAHYIDGYLTRGQLPDMARMLPAPPAEGSAAGYPSGHASIGWATALVLAELAPGRTDALLARGHAFGDSRAICRVHYRSDIEAGRLVGAATVARLHADPVFNAQLAEARREIAAARARGATPPSHCDADMKALP